MLLLESNLEYNEQPGVNSLTTPVSGDRIDDVYLDVWLDEVGPAGDPDIIDPAIGFETSRRIKLNWLVKVAQGGTASTHYLDGNGRYHWVYKIATLNRLNGNEEILAEMIVDHRNDGKALKSREYLHRQAVAGNPWIINHNLGTEYVQVVVYDGDNEQIVPGTVTITSANQVVLNFGDSNVHGMAIIKGLTAF